MKHPYTEDIDMDELWGEGNEVSSSSGPVEAAAVTVEDKKEAALSKYFSRPPESALGFCVT